MARCVVIGGGLGGLAAAARLAKLGHDVVVLERRPVLGGAVERVERAGFAWDAGPASTLLPAALRDLFRSTGRPLEREPGLEPLEPCEHVRDHWFADGSVLEDRGRGRGLGQAWLDYVETYGEDWEALRRGFLEHPWDPADPGPGVTARLDARGSLHRRIRRRLRDDRLRRVAAYPFLADGQDPRYLPPWAGLVAFVEQRFGVWTTPGGMAQLTQALTRRLATRGVTVHTGTTVTDLVVRDARVVAVATTAGDVDADVVVCAIDPRLLPALARHAAHTLPAMPPVTAHVGVDTVPEPLTGAAPEVVLHVDPLLVVRRGAAAPEGAAAYTVHGRGRVAEDLLVSLARHGIDLRRHAVTRVDLSARDQVERWGSSPHGVLWQGRGTVRRRLGPRTPVEGLFACGAHAAPGLPGAGIASTVLSAAQVAELVGPA